MLFLFKNIFQNSKIFFISFVIAFSFGYQSFFSLFVWMDKSEFKNIDNLKIEIEKIFYFLIFAIIPILIL